jgi:hypothetical protein
MKVGGQEGGAAVTAGAPGDAAEGARAAVVVALHFFSRYITSVQPAGTCGWLTLAALSAAGAAGWAGAPAAGRGAVGGVGGLGDGLGSARRTAPSRSATVACLGAGLLGAGGRGWSW